MWFSHTDFYAIGFSERTAIFYIVDNQSFKNENPYSAAYGIGVLYIIKLYNLVAGQTRLRHKVQGTFRGCLDFILRAENIPF